MVMQGCEKTLTPYFFSSFNLLTLLDWHLGQARSTKGPLGSKGILNSCPHLKHLKVASSAISSSPIQNVKLKIQKYNLKFKISS
jgi:hypothetical protein